MGLPAAREASGRNQSQQRPLIDPAPIVPKYLFLMPSRAFYFFPSRQHNRNRRELLLTLTTSRIQYSHTTPKATAA